MKKNVLNYLKVAAYLPLAFIGGVLLLVGVVFNVLASLLLGNTSDAKDYMNTIK